MMQRTEDRGTPSDLQAKILEGLLSGGHRMRSAQPVNQDLPVKNIVTELLNVFAVNPADAQLKTVEQKQLKLNTWWSDNHGNAVMVVCGEKTGDENPCLFLMPTALVEEMLAISLGGQPGASSSGRLPSKMECKFAQRLAPALAQATKPLLRTTLQHFEAIPVPGETVPEFVAEQAIHVIDFSLELHGTPYPISIALPESKIERRAANLAKAAPQVSSNTVATEIGRTVVKLDISVQLADQTLEALHQMHVGDVLPLSGKSLSEAKLAVRGHEIFKGQIGRSGQHFGFQISRNIQAKATGLTLMVKSLTGAGEPQ